jgi:hypothetical protein
VKLAVRTILVGKKQRERIYSWKPMGNKQALLIAVMLAQVIRILGLSLL